MEKPEMLSLEKKVLLPKSTEVLTGTKVSVQNRNKPEMEEPASLPQHPHLLPQTSPCPWGFPCQQSSSAA